MALYVALERLVTGFEVGLLKKKSIFIMFAICVLINALAPIHRYTDPKRVRTHTPIQPRSKKGFKRKRGNQTKERTSNERGDFKRKRGLQTKERPSNESKDSKRERGLQTKERTSIEKRGLQTKERTSNEREDFKRKR